MVDYPTNPEKMMTFGDFTIATLWDCYVDDENNEIVFLFKPTPHMRWKHQIPDSDFDETYWVIKKAYPKDLCYCGDPSTQFQKWFLFCDYYKKPCNFIEKVDQQLLARNQALKAKADAYQKQATIFPLQLKKIIKFPEEAFEKYYEKKLKVKKLEVPPEMMGGGEGGK